MPPKRKTFLGMSLDTQVPLPYFLAGLMAASAFIVNDHNQIQANKRINSEQDKAIVELQQGREADRKANQEMREGLIAFSGKMDTLNAKMDGMRSALSVGAIKAEVSGR